VETNDAGGFGLVLVLGAGTNDHVCLVLAEPSTTELTFALIPAKNSRSRTSRTCERD